MTTFISTDLINPTGDGDDLSGGQVVYLEAGVTVAGGTNYNGSNLVAGMAGQDINFTIEGTVWGAYYGLYMYQGGTLTVGAQGVITGATGDGIEVFSGGNVVVTNHGEISGDTDRGQTSITAGINFGDSLGGNRIFNTGDIDGQYGIYFSGGYNVVTNSGTISGNGTATISANGGTTVISNSGTIESDADCIVVNTTTSETDVDNSGTILAGFNAIDALDIHSTGAFVVTNAGHITGDIHLAAGDDTYDGSLGDVTGYVYGNDGNDTLTGGAGTDTLDGGSGINFLDGMGGNDILYSRSKTDHLDGGDGNDAIYCSSFAATDRIDGGAGRDTLGLIGSYAVTLTAETLVGVERLLLVSEGTTIDENFKIKMDDGNVAAGDRLTIDASALPSNDHLTFDGSAETDGHYTILSGGGADVLTGGALSDKFVFQSAADSTGSSHDTIHALNFNSDRIELPTGGAIAGINAALTTGTLDSGANFNSELTSDLSAHLTAHHAILFTPNGGNLTGDTFLVVDLNGTAGYQSGHDLVIQLIGQTGTLTVADFVS